MTNTTKCYAAITRQVTDGELINGVVQFGSKLYPHLLNERLYELALQATVKTLAHSGVQQYTPAELFVAVCGELATLSSEIEPAPPSPEAILLRHSKEAEQATTKFYQQFQRDFAARHINNQDVGHEAFNHALTQYLLFLESCNASGKPGFATDDEVYAYLCRVGFRGISRYVQSNRMNCALLENVANPNLISRPVSGSRSAWIGRGMTDTEEHLRIGSTLPSQGDGVESLDEAALHQFGRWLDRLPGEVGLRAFELVFAQYSRKQRNLSVIIAEIYKEFLCRSVDTHRSKGAAQKTEEVKRRRNSPAVEMLKLANWRRLRAEAAAYHKYTQRMRTKLRESFLSSFETQLPDRG